MFRRIMLPLDGSELAERALPCAERLATALGALLHVVRVVEPPVKPSFASPHLYDELLTAEKEAAAAYLDGVRERLTATNVPVRIEQPLGHAASTLLDYERDAGIDLVVMCSHGRSGIARFALGSVADRLLRQGAAPVLLVRAFGEPPILNRAVVPLDGSTRAEVALQLV